MSFMDSLASNPSGGGGIYGMPAQSGEPDVLNIVNRLKDREMNDFKEKANFMSDLSLRQDRMKRIFDTQDPQQQQPNTAMGTDPNQMTGYQKGELGIRQQANNLDSQKLAQTAKLGEEALNIKDTQQKLNQQKSDQINADKQKKMEDDMAQYKGKLDLAYQQLQDKNTSAEQQLELHKTIAENTEAYHKLQMEKSQRALDEKDAAFKELQAQHKALLDQNAHTHQERSDAQGNKIITDTDKGSNNDDNDPAGIR